jgi:hypothetical protein
VGEVGGAVQWINDPEITALRTSPVGFFFRQDPVIREVSLQYVDDDALGLAIHRSDQIYGAFVIDLFRPLPVVKNECSRRSGRVPHSVEKLSGHQ